MTKILHVSPVGWAHMKNEWWQFVLIGIILGSVSLGFIYLVYSSILRCILYFESRQHQEKVPAAVSARIDELSRRQLTLVNSHSKCQKPSSVGVYLGQFDGSLSEEDQMRFLSEWDMLIVDPYKPGVVQAVASAAGKQILGRLDFHDISPKQDMTLATIDRIEKVLSEVFEGSAFTGILLANWEGKLASGCWASVLEAVQRSGLSIYLETAPPEFLPDRNMLQNHAISGLVVRNASILPSGQKRDYFQLEKMRATIKAFVSEACMRDFVVVAWETIDDDATLSNAVVRRSLQWCNFYSAIPWIGRRAALEDLSLNTKLPEPISSFGWLKEPEIMSAHETWRSNSSINDAAATTDSSEGWDKLMPFFPALRDLLASLEQYEETHEGLTTTVRDPPEWVSQTKSQSNPLSTSISGVEYKAFGCFPLGAEATASSFAEILKSQQRLRSLGLLHPVPVSKVQSLGVLLRQFHDGFALSNWGASDQLTGHVKELYTLACNDQLRVHLGLDSGFRRNTDIRFWSVYQMDADGADIFISKNVQGLAGTILHTFLSAKGCPRHVCFGAEVALAKFSKDIVEEIGLPRRLVQDIDVLSPEEKLLLLQHLSLTDATSDLTKAVCAYIQKQLVEKTSLQQLKQVNTVSYLEGSASPETLVTSRIKWYREQRCTYPSISKCLALFREVDSVFPQILKERREADLAQISTAFCQLMEGQVDAYTDTMALALFCAARKGALDEIYQEVTDRNPLFNAHSDQAAAFAESFALGSRCEAYFDISPSAFGKLLSDRFRRNYSDKDLPDWINGAPEMATSYAGAQIDVNPDDKVKPMRGYQRFTFLSVFALPALIDIILLTIIGRGLYLSAFMTPEEQNSATTALMISLLLSGGIGTWIACGGPYYLISMAFAATNMFILIRLIAGLAFTIAGGLIGFVAVSGVNGPRAGIVFYLYLVALTTYFSGFACLASFSYPGSSFLSGRKVIFACIPILFVSPIVTTFTGHESAIYIAVIYVFIGALILGLRRVAAKWVTWYQNLRRTDDTEIRKWYIETHANGDEKVFGNLSDPAVLKLSREALLKDVSAELNRWGIFTRHTTKSTLVLELARDWEATNFLLDWYCRYADVPRPIPFSSGWNTQTKVALDSLRSAQRGIRLHNAFIHWRQSSREIGCGVVYFVVALLDKWVELLSGGHMIGLSPSLTSPYRMAVGFALAYYLIGAVLIDTKAQELHSLVGSHKPQALKTAKDIRDSQKRDVRFKRKVYWKTFGKFLMWHSWGLAFSAALVWTFQSQLEAMIMFLAYVGAYTGLLWYQYTKIFTGPHALKPLLIGSLVGLPIGIALRACLPHFLYSQVIGLGAATWTVAFLSIIPAKMGMPKRVDSPVELGKTFHAYTAPWEDPDWSQQELQTFYENISLTPLEARLKLNPASHPGTEVKQMLLSRRREPRIEEAFPHSQELVETALKAWESGEVLIELVPLGSIGPGIHALSCSAKDHLKIAVAVGRGLNHRIDVSANCQVIAETLLHAVAESIMQIPHEHAVLAESLVSAGVTETTARQLRDEADTPLVVRWAKRELLRQLCLGFECDFHWETLPKAVRKALVSRCLGEPCRLAEKHYQLLEESICQFDIKDLAVHIARSNLAAAAAVSILDYARYGTGEAGAFKDSETPPYIPYLPKQLPTIAYFILKPLFSVYYVIGAALKFLVVAMVADPEFQREYNHVMSHYPTVVRVPATFALSIVWKYGKAMQDICLSFFLFHGRDNVKQLWNETKGMTINIKKSRYIVQSLDGTFTAFRHDQPNGGFKVFYYAGTPKTEPQGTKSLSCVSAYSKDLLLLIRQEYKGGNVINEYHYDYRSSPKKSLTLKLSESKIPMGRRCVRGENHLQSVQYNRKGLIEAGSYMKDGNLIRFKYHYRKNPQFGDELLRAEFALSHITCTVSWCAPPLRHPEKVERWIPHAKVTEATFVQGPDVYEARWLYDHKFHPTIFTTLNGQKIQTPPMIEHDFLEVLAKPRFTSFVHDNPLFYCESLSSNILTRLFGLTRKRFPVSTSRARSLIWKAWKDRPDFDGIIVRWMDERLLRRDRTLSPYWRSRDWGDLASAKKYLELRADTISASADLDDGISSWTPLAVKVSDLFNFGPGGDAVVNTRSNDFGSDTEKSLHVMAADTGTWPNEGGGVSACRRDMINSLRTIKWHMICESANDFGVPKHQTEQNILSLKVIPLWGMDFLTPTHGLFRNKLDSEVESVTSANDMDIKMNFIPILTALVKGARAVHLSKADIRQATRALVNLNTFFQDSRHWTQIWNSSIVKESWRELWLTQEMPNTMPSSEWFSTDLPTLGTLDVALELWFRYLFIFSIPIPEKIPSVFQASHHSVSASYGVVCKMKRNCTLQIWDHAISWRETNLCLSSALCKLSPFVRNALLGLMRVTSALTLYHADIISPCADFFNPGWEVEIGTCQGTIEHRNVFRRKVDPVVNGITDMQKFAPVKEIKSDRPTVTMLSHVWYAKDIKTALLAADIIINQWKFDDYHLDIYGAIDKAPTYSTECQEIIASKGLRGRVTLRGTADPMKVLESTWLFLNSSLSEGLPLALGEAALTGAPVVCTDVGASLRVLSDPDDFSRFSAVVAPNDAVALARAQISMLALLGEWSQYADDTAPAPVLPSSPTPEDVARITQRMYDKADHRRKLGMMTRKIVQKSFSGDRYLREHEQMLWIGKSAKMMSSRLPGIHNEPADIATAIQQALPIEEEVITIPRSAVHSWRSSAASGMSTLYSSSASTPFLNTTTTNTNVNTNRPTHLRNNSTNTTAQRPSSLYSGFSNASTDASSFLPLPNSPLPVFAPRHSFQGPAATQNPNSTSNPTSRPSDRRSYSGGGRLSPRFTRSGLSAGTGPAGRRSRSNSLSTGGREQLRGLQREDLQQYRNSDVSTIMREEFFQSSVFRGLEGHTNMNNT